MNPESKPLKSYVGGYRWKAAAGFSCVAGAIVIGLWVPFLYQKAIDGLEQGTMAYPEFARLILLFLAGSAAATLLSVFMRKVLLGLAQRVEHDIRRDIFHHLTTLDAAYFQNERTGDIMTKMTSDLLSVRDLVGQGLLQGSRIVIGFPLAFGIMFYLNVKLALTIMAVLPVISLVFFFIIRIIRTRYDAVQEQFSTISTYCQEMFAGFRAIKGFGIEQRARERFRDHNGEFVRLNMSLTRVEEPVWPFMMFMFALSNLLILFIGGRLVIEEQLTLGRLIQFNQYMLYLQWPMLALGWTTNLFQRGMTSWKRIRTILEATPAIRDDSCTDPATTQVRGDIRLDGVSLVMDDATLLRDINLTIPEGQCVGLTGPTGSGKTLLVNLMMRLVDPTTGLVTIGGRDVRTIPLTLLRRAIGAAPQEPFLFSDTLANNIAFGLTPAESDSMAVHGEKIAWASRVAHLQGDIEAFPRRYGTVLGERGITLSGGQRQRTAISRALAVNPRILILDDVFSAVDTQTEAGILQQLLPVLKDRTAILVSHRVSTLKHADRILVIENGRVTADGTHADLIAREGYYRDLDEMQKLEARLEEVP